MMLLRGKSIINTYFYAKLDKFRGKSAGLFIFVPPTSGIVVIFACREIINMEELLKEYARRYETERFLYGDPSWFMHQVEGKENQEIMAFMAAALSYGSREQFLPKIQLLLDASEGEPDRWVREGAFSDLVPKGDGSCFYRLYTKDLMNRFLEACRKLLLEYGSLGDFVPAGDAIHVLEAICAYFSGEGLSVIVPKDTKSSCKRLCMFLRWMVRDSSPVDLGLWADRIPKKSLIIPLDTHVLTEAGKLGLISSRCASMAAAMKLTAKLSRIFPDDPLKGDFALFGYGVDYSSSQAPSSV